MPMRTHQTGRPRQPHTSGPRAAGVVGGLVGALLAILLAGCGTGERDQSAETSTGAAGTGTPAPAAPPTRNSAAENAAGDTVVTPELVARGDSIFHGQMAGGTCLTCHGQNAAGSQIGPSLADAEWLHGDGSYPFLVNTITAGVPTPKRYPAAMPPMGGAQLTAAQVRAVAAYVYARSHSDQAAR